MISVAIIDDNYREVEPIIKILESDHNYTYKYFGNCDNDTKEWLSTSVNPIVLLDLFFHGVELGESVFQTIKTINDEIPIFIFTSTSDLFTEGKYKEMGCYDYIVKNRVQEKDALVLLQRIQKASETGGKFNKDFIRIKNTWLSDQERAILELYNLLSTDEHPNLIALYQLRNWIKGYLKKGIEDIAIAMPLLLQILEQACKKIEGVQKDLEVDVILDKILCCVHMGKDIEAEALLKQTYPMITDQGERFLNMIMTLLSLRSNKKPVAKDIFKIIDIDSTSADYEGLLELIYHYDKSIWNEAILDYLNYLKTDNAGGRRKILSLFKDGCSYIAAANVSLSERPAIIKSIYETFLSEVEQVNNETIESLYHCCEYILTKVGKDDVAAISEKDLFCRRLNKLSTALFLIEKPADWIKFIDKQIINIGATEDDVIRDLLDRSGVEKVNLLYQILENLFRDGEKDIAIKILQKEESCFSNLAGMNDVIGVTASISVSSHQLYRFGLLLEENRDHDTARKFLNKAIQGLFNEITMPDARKKRNDILVCIQDIIRRLKAMGDNVEKCDEIYQRLSSENVRIPLPLDNKRCAIAGGGPDIETNLNTFKETFGGEWTFCGTDTKKIQRLKHSIKNGGFDVVIYITGKAPHEIDRIIRPAVDEYKKDNTLNFIMLETQFKNISGILAEVKNRLDKDYSNLAIIS